MMLRRLYNWTIEKAGGPNAEWWLALFAFMEASFFPVPPHPILLIMCVAKPQRAIRYAAVATVASVVGGLLGYAIGYYLYDALGAQLLHVLGLSKSFPKAACILREHGWEIVIGKGVTPIPFKLITITAGFIGMPLLMFIGASLISRSISFMMVGVLFKLFGASIKTFIDRYLIWVTIGFVALIVGGFLLASALTGGTKSQSDKCDTVTAQPAH